MLILLQEPHLLIKIQRGKVKIMPKLRMLFYVVCKSNILHKTTKEIWDKLKNIYDRDDKVKKENIQTHRGQFESLKIKEDKNIASYLLQFDEIVNTIRGLGEIIEENVILQKVLRSLSLRFDAKVSTIVNMRDLDKLSKDELHGILTAYEMRTIDQPSKREASFKVSRKGKNKDDEPSNS